MENINEVEPVFDFGLFKTQFILALKKTNGVCKGFISDISDANDIDRVARIFKSNREPIGEWLGLDLNPDCPNCDRAEFRLGILESELEQYKDLQQSVADEYKLKAFVEHRNNYNIEELEILFHNGKTLLEMLNKTER